MNNAMLAWATEAAPLDLSSSSFSSTMKMSLSSLFRGSPTSSLTSTPSSIFTEGGISVMSSSP